MKAVQEYQCMGCHAIYDDEFDAAECCKPEVWTVFVCGECKEAYDTPDEATECCGGDGIETEHGYRQHIEQLERAGQQRLIP